MVVYFNTYKLRKGASIPDFKEAVNSLIETDFTNRQGFISFKLLAEGDGFADYSEWETMEDYNAFLEAAQSSPSETALAFYAFLNMNSCKSRVYTVEIDM
jgi:heme-degrading monooxygenase HmoA